MSRSGQLLIAGFAVLLVGSVVLLRSVMSDEATANTGGGSVSLGSAVHSEPANVMPAAPADAWSRTVAIPQPSPPRSGGRPEIANTVVVPSDDDDSIEYDANGKPIPVANLSMLRKASVPTDNMIRQCIIDSGVKGLTGKAVLTFTVAKKRNKNGEEVVETESTGFEEEGTTIDNPALLECMHKTALQMKFPPSKSPIAVWARRRINIDNNELNENWVYEFGRIR